MAKGPLVDPSVDLTGKLAVVTGSNTGIGKITARELARAGAEVILACRSEEKATRAMDGIREAVPEAKLSFHALDLGSVAKTRASAEALKAAGRSIDILVNNAGLAGAKGMTDDGFEITFGVNHIGPFVFTMSLLDCLTDGGRVVVVASKAHARIDTFDIDAVRQPAASRTSFTEYCGSKLCNVLFARRLATQLAARGITVYSLHPGVVASDIWRKVPWPLRPLIAMFMLTVEEGARTSLHCATSPEAQGQTGLYWDKCSPKTPSDMALDDALMNDVWDKSVAWTSA